MRSDLSLDTVPERKGPLPPQHSTSPVPALPERQPDVALAESPGLGVFAALDNDAAEGAKIVMDIGSWRNHPTLDVYLPPPGDRAAVLDAVAATTRDLQRAGYRVAVQPDLAEAVAAHRAPVGTSFNTLRFRAEEAALARSAAAWRAPAAAERPAGPPPAAADPRVAFARAR